MVTVIRNQVLFIECMLYLDAIFLLEIRFCVCVVCYYQKYDSPPFCVSIVSKQNRRYIGTMCCGLRPHDGFSNLHDKTIT